MNPTTIRLGYMIACVAFASGVKLQRTWNNKTTKVELNKSQKREKYLRARLDEEGIEMTEFDEMALNLMQ